MAQPKLYMIATPIGNIQDVTLRALEIFKQLEVFFAEDSRELLKLFNLLSIPVGNKKVLSYASHNMKTATEKALEFLQEGKDLGFVSDRGTPCISDPGAVLVESARNAGAQIIPIPGVSSVTTIFSVSGIAEGQFLFLGFLPSTMKDRDELFKKIENQELPACIFESPKRIRTTVSLLKEKFPFGKIFIGREMTKLYESFNWFSLETISLDLLPEIGEYVLILIPGKAIPGPDEWMEDVRLRLAPDKEWSKSVATRFGLSASQVYNALQRLKHPS